MAESNQEQNNAFSQAKKEALSLMESGAYASGQIIISALLSLKPDDAFLWFELFEARRQMGQWPEAIVAFEKANQETPREHLWTLYVRRAILESDRGCPSEAERWFHIAFTSPEILGRGWPHILRAANLLKLEKPVDALSILQKAQNIDNDIAYDELYHMMGSCYLAINNYTEAEKCFRKAQSLNPDAGNTREMVSLFNELEKARQLAASITASTMPVPPPTTPPAT